MSKKEIANDNSLKAEIDAPCGQIDIEIDGGINTRGYHTKHLGLTINFWLAWSEHVDEISTKVSSINGTLKSIRLFSNTV